MKAIVLDAFGGVDNFRRMDLPTPVPQKGQVRIRIKGVGLNPVDYKIRRGGHGGSVPVVLGHDAAGVIEAVGQDVKGWSEGDEVHAMLGSGRSNGSYAECACIDQGYLARKPASLSWEQSAALPVAGLTAYECVYRKTRPKRGTAVFVAGGSGGVGSMAIELLRHLGAQPVITTAGSDRSAGFLTDHLHVPPEHIVRYAGRTLQELITEVTRLSEGGVGMAYDFVGGEMKRLCAAVTVLEGEMVSIVEEPDDFTMGGTGRRGWLFQHSASFHSEFLLARGLMGGRREWKVYGKELSALDKLLEDQALVPPMVTVLGDLSVESIRAGHLQLETGHTQGKLALRVQ